MLLSDRWGQGIKIISSHWKPLTVFLLALITWLSLRMPGELVMPAGNDKLHHCLAYAALAFPVSMAKPRWFFLYLLAMFFYSAMIELIQPWFYREMDGVDLLANSLGLVLGFSIAGLVNKLYGSTSPATTSPPSDAC